MIIFVLLALSVGILYYCFDKCCFEKKQKVTSLPSTIPKFVPNKPNNILQQYQKEESLRNYLSNKKVEMINNYKYQNHKYTDISHIDKNIYLGNWNSAIDKKILETNKIQSILCLNDSMVPEDIVNYYNENNISYKYIKIDDHSSCNIKKYFNECIDFLDLGCIKGNVLVHCTAGISRSATIVIMYLMKKYNESYEHILSYVKGKRKCVDPNKGFLEQLQFDFIDQ